MKSSSKNLIFEAFQTYKFYESSRRDRNNNLIYQLKRIVNENNDNRRSINIRFQTTINDEMLSDDMKSRENRRLNNRFICSQRDDRHQSNNCQSDHRMSNDSIMKFRKSQYFQHFIHQREQNSQHD